MFHTTHQNVVTTTHEHFSSASAFLPWHLCLWHQSLSPASGSCPDRGGSGWVGAESTLCTTHMKHEHTQTWLPKVWIKFNVFNFALVVLIAPPISELCSFDQMNLSIQDTKLWIPAPPTIDCDYEFLPTQFRRLYSPLDFHSASVSRDPDMAPPLCHLSP